LAVAELPIQLTNELPYGYTIGDLTGGYFLNSGFGVALEESVARVVASNLSLWAKHRVIFDLQSQAIVSGQLDVSTHEAKKKLIDAQDLTGEARAKKHRILDNTAIVQSMTKHEAKALKAAAATDDERAMASLAMAKVKRTVTKAPKEMDDVEHALAAVRKEWPAFAVITQAQGKQWPETEPQKGDRAIAFDRWRRAVTPKVVTSRVESGLRQINPERRRVVGLFKKAIKIYNTAVSRHDKAVRTAKAEKIT
jgi:hypothetical protein